MLTLNRNYFIIGFVGLLLLNWYIVDDIQVTDNQDKEMVLKKVNNKESKEIDKISQKNVGQNIKIQKEQKSIVLYQRSYQNTHLSKKTIKNESFIEKKALQQKQRRMQAKLQYERAQQLKARSSAMYKKRQEYHNMQKFLNSRDPNKIQNRSKMMQNKQVRSYMAKVNYQKRQKQIQEQMKMRSRRVE
ncbi:MAG: hypothetical protein KAJ49_05435 [Arcobacteraceae bacterium]|nr:hypothetical protein [Arcobacteraceae bacterium]